MTAPRRALVIIDAQQEYFDGILQIQHPDREASLTNITRVMDLAAARDLPVVVVQHELPEGAPVFAKGSASWELHPEVAGRVKPEHKRITKDKASVFAGNDVADWLAGPLKDSPEPVVPLTNGPL